jgi:predicted oxidoreductase
MGTLSGLAVDREARVRRIGGDPIPGLYACGNVMANLVEGRWYTSGTSNGRGLFFGAAAATHAMSL